MAKLFGFFCGILCLLNIASAQKMHKGYRDGVIWYKIKEQVADQYRTAAKMRFRKIVEFPFLQSMRSKFRLKTVEAPFAAARSATPLQNTYELYFDENMDADNLISELKKNDQIEYAEKVPLDEVSLIPNDAHYINQWHLSKINAAAAWDHTTGDNMVIAIVDVGVQRTHPDLSPNLWVNPGEVAGNGVDDDGNGYIDDINGWDIAFNDNNPNPPNNQFTHGTTVAGAASAATNNGIGVASMGYNGKLMCINAASSPESISHGYAGILYAADNGAHVINCSWGTPSTSQTALNVVNYAFSKGCVIVASAGNENSTIKRYPAAHPGVIGVGATNESDIKTSFSNYGSWVTVSAPGVAIRSTLGFNSYWDVGGTSYSAPITAGLVALIRSVNPLMPRADVIHCLTSTAVNIDAQNPDHVGMLGGGRIDAAAAIQCALATLSYKPVPVFSANQTIVFTGGAINFEDQSYYGPESYHWIFEGGTPATFTGKNPPTIKYHTPGTYDVSLTVSNANGSATESKTDFITVNPIDPCMAINYPLPANWDSVNYYLGSPEGLDGWVNGNNVRRDKQKAMYFDISATPANYITKVRIKFGLGASKDPLKVVPVHVYDGSAGTPGALLATTFTTMGQVVQDVHTGVATIVHFQQPVPVPVSNRFFISVDLTNLCWDDLCKDTLSILSSGVPPATIWEQKNDNQWYPYFYSPASYYVEASLFIHPYITNTPARASFTSATTTVCAGNTVQFDASGSTFDDGLSWSFEGGTPGMLQNHPQPTVFFGTPGTYLVKLTAQGGACHDVRTDSLVLQVNSPVVPSILLNSNMGTVPAGSPVTFTVSAEHGGSDPQFTFKVNDSIAQTGSADSWIWNSPVSGDTVVCELTTDLECVTASTVSSNIIVMPAGGNLPVNLLYFRGTSDNKGNHFNWATATEINTAYFAVERSTDGQFYTEVGRVNAHGQSNEERRYNYFDNSPYPTGAYYRLRITDRDGHTDYSQVIHIATAVIGARILQIWPHPAQRGQPVEIKIMGLPGGKHTLQLVNTSGQVMQTLMAVSTNGVCRFTVHIGQLPSGVYGLRCFNEKSEVVITGKLVVAD